MFSVKQIKRMEDRLRQVEKDIELLKQGEKIVYVLSIYNDYYEKYVIEACYSNSRKVAKAATKILDGYTVSKEEINKLDFEEIFQSDNDYYKTVRIQKFLMK